AQVLRTIHRARHTRGAQRALSAHLAVEQRALDQTLSGRDRSFEPLIPNSFPQRMQAAHYGLKRAVEGVETAGVAHRPAAQCVHQDSGGVGGIVEDSSPFAFMSRSRSSSV